VARSSATARGSRSTPPTAARSSARRRPPAPRRPRARDARGAQALAAAFDVVVVETVGVRQSETEVAETADTVAVAVQPGAGDVLQFLKAGIMEIPDVLVVTKADLGEAALRARRDLAAALRSVGARTTPVVAVSALPPASGSDALVDALDAHRAALDVPPGASRRAARTRSPTSRQSTASADCVALGGARAARQRLEEADPAADVPALVAALEAEAGVR
jgi:LAO/AO transport system kinase